MRSQDLTQVRLVGLDSIRLDSTLLVCTDCRGGHCKKAVESRPRLFEPDWNENGSTRLCWWVRTLIGRDGCYFGQEMNVERVMLLVKDHQTIYDASHCEPTDYIACVWQVMQGKWAKYSEFQSLDIY
jgi:hypothetical protein